MSKWIIAAGICIAAVVLETICSGRAPAEQLKKVRQPAWALPFSLWVVVGVAYYVICFFVLLRLLNLQETPVVCIWLLALLMVANAFGNVLFFRWRDYRVSFFYLIPYSALTVGSLWCIAFRDRRAAFAFGLYALYLPYAVAWTYRVWKMNGTGSTGG